MQTLDAPIGSSPQTDGVSTIYGLTWEDFQDFEARLSRSGNRVKLFYLHGVLEIVSPIGKEHEAVKRTLNLLLEAYMREKGIRFYASGGFTIAAIGTASGIPDDSYCIGTLKPIPDIVIEVIITSGSIDKREIYRPHEVPEVWFWSKRKLIVYQLQSGSYRQVDRSQFYPDLDLQQLIPFLNYRDQFDAVQDFTAQLRRQ
ncbi:Uma2 family endonuclease [Microcoleus sp. FACHB-1515]|uniref:Uma2 family endonuclease n=1 Tax=Cyanophyceae TaxID=3028117 RepID=UPI001685B966|nr:Uma2 family endonuclease [Microcoleus sp. FACHB-1515]MBD2093537.1 Uma2 family endonuclease [Microcoleus sp. FACHB-1515]